MAVSMLSLYAVSALAPFLVADLGLTRAAIGSMVTATFAVAAAVSLVAGRLVDMMGVRFGLVVLSATVMVALLAASMADSYGWLVAALAVTGVAQALVNPATNVLVVQRVPAQRRGVAIGIKQSGVQVAAFTAGLGLPVLVGVVGWRAGLRWTAVAAALLLVAVLWLVPRGERVPVTGSWWRLSRPSRWLGWLMGYSLLLGTAQAAVNTYIPLYASQGLGLGKWAAGTALATFGLSGLFGRVWWTRWADRLPVVTAALPWLAAGAAGSVTLVALAVPLGHALLWIGVIGVGGTATGANAVSMLAIVRRGGATGHASALVSLGFFSGFVIGPVLFGLLADHYGYGAAWPLVAVVFGGCVLMTRGLSAAANAEVPQKLLLP
jgi:predicted MFS family arabinose efflux permease